MTRHWLLTALLLFTPAAAFAQASPAADGQHLVREVELTGLTRPDGKDSTLRVVLPVSAAQAWPTVLFLHGWSAEPIYYQTLANNLASRGFAVALFDQVDRFDYDLPDWIQGAGVSVDALEAAASDPTSPLFGEIDLSNLAVMGHSYGGVTTICFAAVDARVKVAVALTPGADMQQRDLFLNLARQVTVPLLVVGAEFDPVVTPYLWALPGFRSALTPHRLYVEIARGEHNNISDADIRFPVWRPFSRRWVWTVAPAEQRRISRSYATAWIEHHTGVRADTGGWTDGRQASADFRAAILSRWSR